MATAALFILLIGSVAISRRAINKMARMNRVILFKLQKFISKWGRQNCKCALRKECERQTGLEPATLGLGSQCSTNWATAAFGIGCFKGLRESKTQRHLFSKRKSKKKVCFDHVPAHFLHLACMICAFFNWIMGCPMVYGIRSTPKNVLTCGLFPFLGVPFCRSGQSHRPPCSFLHRQKFIFK